MDFFFKPKLNTDINLLISNLLSSVDTLYLPSSSNITYGCRGLRILGNKIVLCGDETVVGKQHCYAHIDIAARTNIIYHNIDPNFQKLIDIVDNKVKKTSMWHKELTKFTGLLTSDRNLTIPGDDIPLIVLDWDLIFNIVDDVELSNYLETIDDVVYVFLVADLIYSIRLLSQVVLYNDIGIDPGHLRYLILTLHVRNKLASIIKAPIIRLNLSINPLSLRDMLDNIEATKNACLYLHSTLEMFTTFNKIEIDARYNPFFLINPSNLSRRDNILLPIAKVVTSNYLYIYSTQAPRNNCSNMSSILYINNILSSYILDERELTDYCNNTYSDLYELFNCIIHMVNRKLDKSILPLNRVSVRTRPEIAPRVISTTEFNLIPYSRLARHSPSESRKEAKRR